MSQDPSWADLPAEVTAARLDLLGFLAEAGGDVPEPTGRSSSAPAVALVGAPGRGRRALAAALLDRPVDAIGPGVEALGAAEVDVPLLEHLDLLLPPRSSGGVWSVAGASALVVVAGAGAPLDRTELDRVAEAAGQVQAVVFALVGTESHRGWRTVLDADRALVAEHVPRLAGATWFGVSPVLAASARGTGTAGEAARRQAGLAPLQQYLHRLVARRRRMLDEANALRAALTAVRVAVPPQRPAPAALAAQDDALHRRRDALAAARTGLRREHHVRWRSEVAAARVAVLDDVGRRTRVLTVRFRDRVESASRRDLTGLELDLARDLETVACEAVTALGDRLRGIVVDTLAGLVGPAELAELRIPAPTPHAEVPAPGPRTADRMLVVAGATGGLGLSRLALLPLLALPVAPVVGAALVPVSVVVGLGAAGWLVRTRRRAADRAHTRVWLTEAIGQARIDLERVLSEALIVADREITLALDRGLDEHARRLDADLSEVSGRLAARARDQARDQARAERGAAVTARADAVLARIDAALHPDQR